MILLLLPVLTVPSSLVPDQNTGAYISVRVAVFVTDIGENIISLSNVQNKFSLKLPITHIHLDLAGSGIFKFFDDPGKYPLVFCMAI